MLRELSTSPAECHVITCSRLAKQSFPSAHISSKTQHLVEIVVCKEYSIILCLLQTTNSLKWTNARNSRKIFKFKLNTIHSLLLQY